VATPIIFNRVRIDLPAYVNRGSEFGSNGKDYGLNSRGAQLEFPTANRPSLLKFLRGFPQIFQTNVAILMLNFSYISTDNSHPSSTSLFHVIQSIDVGYFHLQKASLNSHPFIHSLILQSLL